MSTSPFPPSTPVSMRAARVAIALLAGLALLIVFGAEPASAQISAHRDARHGHHTVRLNPRRRPARRHRHRRAPRGAAHVSIIGGKTAAYGTFPWLAHVTDDLGEVVEECTGTVVASNLVLTAGHCAENPENGEIHEPGGFRVATGNVTWTSPESEVSGVSRVIVYPHYEISGALNNWGDAGLLELSTPTKAPAIKLASSEIWKPGTEAAIAGWGDTYYGQETATERLRWAITYVQSKEWCTAEAPGFHPLGQLCAIDPPYYESGTCEGDSGGPLLALRPGTEELVEIGVTSIGYGECSTTWPDVFTRSDLVASWVNARITELAPPPPAPPPPMEPKPPTMTSAEAKTLVRRGLTEDFRAKFKRRHEYRVRCKRIEAAKQRCGVSWYYGPNDYWGSITVYYFIENGEVFWDDRYAIHWVNDHCYYHTSHWRSCQVHTRRR
jgi:Trypsin